MIIESLILGASSIFVSSLLFADRILKRQKQERDQEKEELKQEEEELKQEEKDKWEVLDNKKIIKIRPFLNIIVGTQCILCGYPAAENAGLKVPKACSKDQAQKNCKIEELHMHVNCTACGGSWLMEPRIK